MAGKKKSKSKRSSATSSKAAAAGGAAAEDSAKTYDFTLANCGDAFWGAVKSLQCPAELETPEDEAAPLPATCPGSIESTAVAELLAWFAAGAEKSVESKLSFAATLGKDERAAVHKVVEGRFAKVLETASEGAGDARYISVYVKGHAPKKEATVEEMDKANAIYKWAKDAGMSVSRDEVLQQVQADSLTAELAALWKAKSSLKSVTDALLAAATAGDTAGLKKLLDADPTLVRLPASDFMNGELPMHAAARTGQVAAIRLLSTAGFGVDAKNAAGKTPLQVSRTFEQCDAEAALLQLGAVDPEAKHFPLNDAAASLRAGAPAFVPSGAAASPAKPAAPTPAPAPAPAAKPAAAPAAAAKEGPKPQAPAPTATPAPAAPAAAVAAAKPAEAPKAKEAAAAAAPAAATPAKVVGATDNTPITTRVRELANSLPQNTLLVAGAGAVAVASVVATLAVLLSKKRK